MKQEEGFMSKKQRQREMQAFKEGMEAGAKPFEEKFEQHAKELKKSKSEIMHQVNEIGLVQDEMLDIEEEHEEQLKRLNEKVQYGLKDKASVNELEKGEKEVLGGILVALSKILEFNENQKKFNANVLRLLGIANPQSLELDVIENVENITVQKVMYRVILELLFLENSGSNISEESQEVFDYFSISKKQKSIIWEETENFYNTVGDSGLVEKYFVSPEELKKKSEIPRLEVTNLIEAMGKYSDRYPMPAIFVEDDNMLLAETYKSYSIAESKYTEVIKDSHAVMMSYLKSDSNNYVGNEITEYYADSVITMINQIIDFVDANKLRINITDLMEMRDDCQDAIANCVKKELGAFAEIYSNYSSYLLGMKIDETEDFTETLFGGMKEITAYEPSYDSAEEATDRMSEDIQRCIEGADNSILAFVMKYVLRITDFQNKINEATGNDEVGNITTYTSDDSEDFADTQDEELDECEEIDIEASVEDEDDVEVYYDVSEIDEEIDDYEPYDTGGYTYYKAWENCIEKANRYYRNLKREIDNDCNYSDTERMGDEFQDANWLLAKCICNKHHESGNKWTYGALKGGRWNKERDEILQIQLVGFNMNVRVIDFSMHDEFMVNYENASVVYTLDGEELKFRKR